MNLFVNIWSQIKYYFQCNKQLIIYNEDNKTVFKSYLIYNGKINMIQSNIIIKYPDNPDLCIPEDKICLLVKDRSKNESELFKENYKDLFDRKKCTAIIGDEQLKLCFFKSSPLFSYLTKPFSLSQSKEIRCEERDWGIFNEISIISICIALFIMSYLVGRHSIIRTSRMEPDYSKFDLQGSALIGLKDVPETQLECLVCYQEFVIDDKIRKLPCEHYYHSECIDKWIISRSRVCPLCRKPVRVVNLED